MHNTMYTAPITMYTTHNTMYTAPNIMYTTHNIKCGLLRSWLSKIWPSYDGRFSTLGTLRSESGEPGCCVVVDGGVDGAEGWEGWTVVWVELRAGQLHE